MQACTFPAVDQKQFAGHPIELTIREPREHVHASVHDSVAASAERCRLVVQSHKRDLAQAAENPMVACRWAVGPTQQKEAAELNGSQSPFKNTAASCFFS